MEHETYIFSYLPAAVFTQFSPTLCSDLLLDWRTQVPLSASYTYTTHNHVLLKGYGNCHGNSKYNWLCQLSLLSLPPQSICMLVQRKPKVVVKGLEGKKSLSWGKIETTTVWIYKMSLNTEVQWKNQWETPYMVISSVDARYVFPRADQKPAYPHSQTLQEASLLLKDHCYHLPFAQYPPSQLSLGNI